ncbi:MAG: hypothetical protein Unbinned2903contig1001_21 [Prokaryotic dsDNA virus sp.]|nr:MAG: hypothetical protein Unbinned2903contig1001_21 [Prokaryotic dsDNA virus sp.]|tara:strand:+ start:10837 stop:11532 length:696 start_codon:yes stop_codon:yes gene_type:complete
MFENELTQVFNEIVDGIDSTIVGTYDVATNKTYFCDTKWLRVGKDVTMISNGNEYRIIEIEYDNWVEWQQISGTSIVPLSGEISIPTPIKLSGTKIAANNEWRVSNLNVGAKTPLVWLLKILSKNEYGREDTRLFSSDLKVFFLDETDVTSFGSAEHTKQVVYPMERLCEYFLKSIKSNRKYKTIDEYQKFYFDRFGVESENGVVQNIIDANLSGVQLQLSLTKYKPNCKC